MSETTLLKRNKDMARKPLSNCHEGKGILDHISVLNREDIPGSMLCFFHDNILAPGVSIGEHTHSRHYEMYYIVSGNGTMILDGEEHEIREGDISVVCPGGSHALINSSDKDIRMIVVCVEDNIAACDSQGCFRLFKAA